MSMLVAIIRTVTRTGIHLNRSPMARKKRQTARKTPLRA